MSVASAPFDWNPLSERIFGPMDWDGSALDEEDQRTLVRRTVIDQLSVDPMTGFPNAIAGDGAMLLAWGTDPVVPLELEGQTVRRMANVLYEIPFPYAVSGKAVFANDLIRTAVLDVGANFFTKDPSALSLGTGTVRVSYRPVSFDGTFEASRVLVLMSFGGDFSMPGGQAKALGEAVRCDPGAEDCFPPQDGLPDIEVLDRRTGSWVQFRHMAQGTSYELEDAARWVDPATGELQVKFVNERTDPVYFQFVVQLEGTIQ
jgi:hypothetical protein